MLKSRMSNTTIAKISIEHYVDNFGILSTVLTDGNLHFPSSILSTLCIELGVKAVATVVLHPQANG